MRGQPTIEDVINALDDAVGDAESRDPARTVRETHEAVAKALGRGAGAIRKWIQNDAIPSLHWKQIAELTGITIDKIAAARSVASAAAPKRKRA